MYDVYMSVLGELRNGKKVWSLIVKIFDNCWHTFELKEFESLDAGREWMSKFVNMIKILGDDSEVLVVRKRMFEDGEEVIYKGRDEVVVGRDLVWVNGKHVNFYKFESGGGGFESGIGKKN